MIVFGIIFLLAYNRKIQAEVPEQHHRSSSINFIRRYSTSAGILGLSSPRKTRVEKGNKDKSKEKEKDKDKDSTLKKTVSSNNISLMNSMAQNGTMT